jgi:undecaprenyl-diphosphatase
MNNISLKKFALVLLSLMVVALIALAIAVHYHHIFNADIFLSKDLQSEGDTPEKQTLIYQMLYYVSLFGKPVIAAVMVAIIGLMFWVYGYFRETVYILLTPLASVANTLLKIIINRPRPSASFVQILATETDPSFPSGHVVFYTVFFGFLFVALHFAKKIPATIRYVLQVLSIILIISISFSRVYLGVHWVTDTIGGYLFGGICLVLMVYYYLKFRKINS